MPLRCLIVDDNVEFLATCRAVLGGDDLVVAGQATTIAEALERAEDLLPDVVLVDIDLGEDSGFDLARRLAARSTDGTPRMVLISAHPADDFADLIAESPALGMISKSELSTSAIADILGDGQRESR